ETVLPTYKIDAKKLKKEYENIAGKDDEKLKNLKSEIEKIEEGVKTYGDYRDKAEESRHKEALEKIKEINLAKNKYIEAQDKYEELDTENDQAKIKTSNKKVRLDKLQNQYKDAYTTNLPFYSWLLSEEDKNNKVKGSFAFLDKILPSYKKAAAEIRKGKKTVKEHLEELQKETGEKKEEGGEKKEEKKI
ncbi:hypothetical protein KGQ29_00475, partial [Patescibacteria group bacterium]|nr:hypothetical protein [Patescibacteria group bacterium]